MKYFLDIKLISLFIFLFIFQKIICEDNIRNLEDISNTCKEYGENNRVKQFADCNNINGKDNNQICCYLSGVNAHKTHYEGCIAVNYDLFNNKTVTYSSTGISGSLICSDDYTSHNYINVSFFNLILFIISLLIL